MQQSVKKYLDYPVVAIKSSTSLDNIQWPEIYICQPGQYNYTTSQHLGYNGNNNLLVGYVNTSVRAQWKGKHENETFDNLAESIFQSNYSDIFIYNDDMKAIDTVRVFINPLGFCLQLKGHDITKGLNIETKERIKVIAVDGHIADRIRVIEQPHSYVETENKQDTFSLARYHIKYEVHDSGLFHGHTCTDYALTKTSYGQCIENAVEDQLLTWYGCLPPWFLFSNKDYKSPKCTNDTANVTITQSFMSQMDLVNLIRNLPMQCMRQCLRPCTQVRIQMTRYMYRENVVTTNYVRVHSVDEVAVFTDAYSYDVLNLIVDLGSSLGLWLGLSAVSIYDCLASFVMQTCETGKQKNFGRKRKL